MRFFQRCCLLLAWLAPGALAAASDALVRIRHGDDPRWASPDLDDSGWDVMPAEGLPMRTGPYWIRFRMRPPAEGQSVRREGFYTWARESRGGPIDSVFLTPAFSFHLYWDGRLLEQNGVIGNSAATEIPGKLNRLVRIPPELLQSDEHVVALRISSYHYNFPATHTTMDVVMENYEQRLIFDSRRPVIPLIGVGAALLVATVCAGFYFLVERRRPLMLGSLLGLAMALFYAGIAHRWLFNTGYHWHCPRLTIITAVMAGIGFLLPWMLLEQFDVPRPKWWLAALVPLLAAAWMSSPIYEVKALWVCRAMLVVAVGAVGWATWRRRPGAWFVLLGLVAGLLVVRTSRRAFLDPSFFLLFDVLVLFPLATLGLQLRNERRRAQEATLAAARLETELLKKNIQPHFLINTLATIMEVIEREPKSAITLIESLAAEFRILARVSGERLIPLGQEIELCRAHLAIMSMRKDARCTLIVEGIDEQLLVPPALFHTLVENGLTHLRPRGGEQRFILRQERRAESICFTLIAEGEPARAKGTSPPPVTREGTGLRYLKARLEESFAGLWTMEGAAVPQGWQTVIEIREPAGAARTAASPSAVPLPLGKPA